MAHSQHRMSKANDEGEPTADGTEACPGKSQNGIFTRLGCYIIWRGRDENYEAGINGVLLLGNTLQSHPSSTDEFNIRVRVFEIPMMQSVVWGQDDGKGGIIGGQAGGDITASFPDGLVIIPTALGSQASGDMIKTKIRDGVEFGCAKEFPRGVGINLNDDYDFDFEGRNLGTVVNSHLIKYDPIHKSEYSLEIKPLAVMADEVLVLIQFGVSNSHSTTTALGRTLIKQTVGLALSKVVLIGFPSKDSGPRGTVYFLALFAVRKIK